VVVGIQGCINGTPSPEMGDMDEDGDFLKTPCKRYGEAFNIHKKTL